MRVDVRSVRVRVIIALAFILVGVATLVAGNSKHHDHGTSRTPTQTTP